MKNFFLAISIGIAVSQNIDLLPTSLNFGTVKMRHDLAKSILGDLDDKIVAAGLISDEKLHEIGSYLGICDKKPRALD